VSVRPYPRFIPTNICAAISSAIFFFWWMWTSRWRTNLLSICSASSFIHSSHPSEEKIAPRITPKMTSVNGA
jgi:hypothetical protein